MTLGERIAGRLADQPTVSTDVGTVRRRVSSAVSGVLLDGVEIEMRTPQPVQVDDEVYVACLNGAWFVLGPTSPKALSGRVLSVMSGSAVVEYPDGSGVSASFMTPNGMTLANGDRVLLSWELGGVVAQRFGTPTPVTPPAPPEPPPAPPQTAVFRAAWSGSVTDAGFWLQGTDVFSRVRGGGRGLWGYRGIKETIPAGKTPTAARLFTPLTAQGGAVSLGWHTLQQRDGAGTTLQGAVGLGGLANGWQDVPVALINNLLGGGPAYGLGIEGASGAVVAGVGRDGMSGALEITWT